MSDAEGRITLLTLAIVLLVRLHHEVHGTPGGPHLCTDPECLEALKVINGEQ